jgi:FixJ family two-component response regulator
MEHPSVFVVEDDPFMRDLLLRVLQRAQIESHAFESAEAFLSALEPDVQGCLLLDLTLPGMNGLALQETLRTRKVSMPVIFLTGSADVESATAGMRGGALDMIEKPFEEDRLLQRVREALDIDRRRRAERAQWGDINERVGSLTAREREVLDLVVAGHANKEIAQLIDASPRTVEVHRARVMRKMRAESLPELVRVMLLWRSGAEHQPA